MMKINDISSYLDELFPDPKCELNYNFDYELLIAIMLSAQSTDKRVNAVTPVLFSKYNSLELLKDADVSDLENIIRSVGSFRIKASHIKGIATLLCDKYNGIVPQTMEELQSLPGVGRKSANVISLEVFGIANGIAVDTHAKRISNRIGLSKEKTPDKIEQDLLKIIPKEYLKDVNHLFVWHGRNTCTARNPKCNQCPIKQYCKQLNVKI